MSNICWATAPSKKAERLLKKFTSQVSLKDLRQDIAEWIESSSHDGITSPYLVITAVQHPGSCEQKVLPQEYRSLAAACMDGSKTLVEILTDFGARSITTDIRNNRFVVTASNGVMITMVLE